MILFRPQRNITISLVIKRFIKYSLNSKKILTLRFNPELTKTKDNQMYEKAKRIAMELVKRGIKFDVALTLAIAYLADKGGL